MLSISKLPMNVNRKSDASQKRSFLISIIRFISLMLLKSSSL
ncbi:hypothetical protein EVA_17334 [gut metagenome]|uniref:Uncharacterized protein n=1 Tax=gut metagenome TaxID=749906 RepID=J9G504_9ZZZZ